MKHKIRVACSYQGGKQRIASQVVDHLLQAGKGSNTHFYDLCCGSGAVSIELVNRGINPSRISMLDISSWGVFWSAIGAGSFNIGAFEQLISELPNDKRDFKAHMARLAATPVGKDEAVIYPLLQACSFGGKQIWRNGEFWANAFFRDYWEPTATSVRRSPANPMQPGPTELVRRIKALMSGMQGVTCINMDIMSILDSTLPSNTVVYVDPPYQSTTKYAFDFDLNTFVNKFKEINDVPLFVSEGIPMNDGSILLRFGGAKGGISGVRKGKHEEWLSRF